MITIGNLLTIIFIGLLTIGVVLVILGILLDKDWLFKTGCVICFLEFPMTAVLSYIHQDLPQIWNMPI